MSEQKTNPKGIFWYMRGQFTVIELPQAATQAEAGCQINASLRKD